LTTAVQISLTTGQAAVQLQNATLVIVCLSTWAIHLVFLRSASGVGICVGWIIVYTCVLHVPCFCRIHCV
jgi:hypothetical protein